MSNQKEILMRLVVGFVTGVILYAWAYFIFVICVFNWIYTLFTGKKIKEIAELSEVWNTQNYTFLRYMTLVSNQRPFPFNSLTKNMSKFEK